MDCSSVSAAERDCEPAAGVQCPNDRKPMCFMPGNLGIFCWIASITASGAAPRTLADSYGARRPTPAVNRPPPSPGHDKRQHTAGDGDILFEMQQFVANRKIGVQQTCGREAKQPEC